MSATNALNNQVNASFTISPGNLYLDNSNSAATDGVVYMGGQPFIQNYGLNSLFLGSLAGNFSHSGSGLLGVGTNALSSVTTAANCTAIGYNSMQSAVSSTNCTSVGYASSINMTSGASNVSIGAQSLFSNTTGSYCTAVGHQSMQLNNADRNCAFGFGSLFYNTAGTDIVAMGYESQYVSLGDYNTSVGSSSLNSLANGTGNCAFGYLAGSNYTTTESNNICIGALVRGTAGESNTTRIGTGTLSCFISGIYNTIVPNPTSNVIVGSNGKLGTVVSSRKYKEDIQAATETRNVLALDPVSFFYKSDETKNRTIGLIAEEVAAIIPDLAVIDPIEGPIGVDYSRLSVYLLDVIKRQQNTINDLSDRIYQIEIELFDN